MENACFDADALIEAYDLGIEKFNGVHTTYLSIYEFLRGLAYLGRPAADYLNQAESPGASALG